MASSILADSPRALNGVDARRSTRIERSVPLMITGHDGQGQGFLERTTAVSVNLHGCRYTTRHECPVGAWVVLRIGDSLFGEISSTVRAQIRSVQPPRDARESFQVGVELEAPANVWCVPAPPEDWLNPRSDTSSAMQTAGATGALRVPEMPRLEESRIPDGPPEVPEPPVERLAEPPAAPLAGVSAPDPALLDLEARLTRTAETAVLTAIRKHLGPAVRGALHSMEQAREATMQQLVDASLRQRNALVHSSREELLARFEDRLDEVRSHWEAQLDGYRMRAEEILNRVDRQAAVSRKELAEAKDFAQTALRQTEPRISAQLELALARATDEFERGAAQAADRHLVRLLEEAQSITREAGAYLESNVAEARATVLTAANAAVDEFRRQAELHATVTVSDAAQRITSALAALDAENRTVCDARRKAIEADVKRTGEQLTEQFRSSLKAFFYSCLVAAVGAVEQHSQVTKEGLSPDELTKKLPEF